MKDDTTSVPSTPLQPADKTCIAPLPYLYDPDDERIVTILKQVTEHCGITLEQTEMQPVEKPQPAPDEPVEEPVETPEEGETEMEEVVTVEGEKPEDVWRKVWQAIRYLSNNSCWTDSDDDTFIEQCRTEQFTAETICGCTPDCCKCDPDQIVLSLSYSPYPNNPLVSADISVVVNGKVARLNLDHNYLNEHFDPFTGKLYIMRDDFPEFLYSEGYGNCCLCKRHLTITVRYNAGYKNIPAGLLTLICPILAQIEEAKVPLSDCAQAMTKVSGLLKSLKKGDVQYTWSDKDTAASRTNALMTDIFDVSLVSELASISRCDQIVIPDEFGDVV